MLQHTYSTKESMMLSPSVRISLNFVSLLKNQLLLSVSLQLQGLFE